MRENLMIGGGELVVIGGRPDILLSVADMFWMGS